MEGQVWQVFLLQSWNLVNFPRQILHQHCPCHPLDPLLHQFLFTLHKLLYQVGVSSRRTTFVSPSLFSPSISPLSWYDPIPAPPSLFIPHFTLSGSATQEATRPARNISEQLSGCLQGMLCTGDCLCYSYLSYCIVDQRYTCRWGWVLLGSVLTLQFWWEAVLYPCCCGFFVHVHVYTCALWVLPCLLCVLCIPMYVL